MTTKNLDTIIESLNEWEALEAEAKEMIDSLKDQLKAELNERNTEELDTGNYIIRYTTVLTNRFDTTAFKKVMPEVYKTYTKQITSRRFTIS